MPDPVPGPDGGGGTVSAVPAAGVNPTAAALLGLLRDGPATGGDLVHAAQLRHGGYFSLTRSQVYRELPVLLERGLVRLGRRGVRASQQYTVSAAGRRAFAAWLAQGAGSGAADGVRSVLLLRLAHAGTLTEPDRRALCEHAATTLADELVTARAAVRQAEGVGPRAAAEVTVAHLRALARAVEKVAATA